MQHSYLVLSKDSCSIEEHDAKFEVRWWESFGLGLTSSLED